MTTPGRAPSRTAVVIGGGSGIGAATARALAADGCTVTVADRDADAAAQVAHELGRPHGAAAVEVTDDASVAALFRAVHDQHGRLDVVVNSAGSGLLASIADCEVEDFRRLLDVNLTGAFSAIKHASAHMVSGGCITTLSSLNGRQPALGMPAYCAAKAGVNMLTEVAALELGPRGIRVNAIAPGLVETPLTARMLSVPGVREQFEDNTPLRRSGTPEDIAQAAVYLCHATWVTGTVLDLNGGAHLMRYPDLPGAFAALS